MELNSMRNHPIEIQKEHLRNLPPKIETRIEKVIEKVEVIPHDYDDL